MTVREIVVSLEGTDADERVRVLTSLLLDLFVEVYALRKVIHPGLGADLDHFTPEVLLKGKTPFQSAYVNAMYTSHNAAGPSSGMEKVLAGFYPTKEDEASRGWRECSVLSDLGFTEEEVSRYVEAATEAETFT